MAEATTMVHVRVSKKLKDQVAKTSRSLGVSLSLITEQAFRDFVANKRLVIEKPLVPTAYLENILEEVEKDIRTGDKKAFSPHFSSAKEMDAYLDKHAGLCK
mgnify:CR=1 FL=1